MLDLRPAARRIPPLRFAKMTYKGLLKYRQVMTPFTSTVVQDYVRKAVTEKGIRSFCETGTFRGDTIFWMKTNFPQIECHSIEWYWLNRALTKARAFGKGVSIHAGDSRTELPKLLPMLPKPVLFWIDAHLWGQFPIEAELDALKQGDGVVLVDDVGLEFKVTMDLIREHGFEPKLLVPTVAAFEVSPCPA